MYKSITILRQESKSLESITLFIHFDAEKEQIITCPICKTLTYRTPKGWHIIEYHHSVISILKADRQCEIITAKTHKLNIMTNIYVE